MPDTAPEKDPRGSLLSLIEKLPQNNLISMSRRLEWIEKILIVEPKRAEWHVKRAGGIGGSEIGMLVTGLRGGYDAFSSPREMVSGKLLRVVPDGGNGHTRRGTTLEPVIQDMFKKRYGCHTESRVIHAMSRVRDASIPWLVGNPDDVCVIGEKRYVIDYKCPMPDTLEDYKKQGGVNFSYAAQLHQMRMLAERAGAKIDGMLLASLDIREWSLDVRVVDFDQSLEEEMIAAGNHYWNDFVMMGIVPDPPLRPKFDLSYAEKDDLEMLNDLALGLVSAKAMESKASDEASEIKRRMVRITEKWQIDDSKIALPGVGIKAKKVLQKDEVIKLASRNGLMDLSAAIEIDDLAFEMIVKELEEAGEDISRCYFEAHAPTISRSKKGSDFELVSREKDEAARVVEDFLAASKVRGLVEQREIVAHVQSTRKMKT